MTDPVQEQLDAYNARDLERFLACYAPDALVEDATGRHIMRDREAMRAAYGELFAASPALRAEVPTRIRAGNVVVDEERVTGLGLPGYPLEVHSAIAYTVRDGRIVHMRILA